jgi:hypothetical protein
MHVRRMCVHVRWMCMPVYVVNVGPVVWRTPKHRSSSVRRILPRRFASIYHRSRSLSRVTQPHAPTPSLLLGEVAPLRSHRLLPAQRQEILRSFDRLTNLPQ